MEGVTGSVQSFNAGGVGTHLAGQEYTVCVRRERNYCTICWSADIFQVSLQTNDGGQSGSRGVSEHDKDCGRLFIPDDTIQPLYAGFQAEWCSLIGRDQQRYWALIGWGYDVVIRALMP